MISILPQTDRPSARTIKLRHLVPTGPTSLEAIQAHAIGRMRLQLADMQRDNDRLFKLLLWAVPMALCGGFICGLYVSKL